MSDKTYKCPSTFEGKPCPGASAPHRRGMCVLAGVNELRDAVQWANNTPEIEHDHLTAEDVLARFRAARDGAVDGRRAALRSVLDRFCIIRPDREQIIEALLNARQAAKP